MTRQLSLLEVAPEWKLDEATRALGRKGVAEALAVGSPGKPVDIRLFAKPATLPNRRMGVALARGETIEEAIALATDAAGTVAIRYG